MFRVIVKGTGQTVGRYSSSERAYNRCDALNETAEFGRLNVEYDVEHVIPVRELA